MHFICIRVFKSQSMYPTVHFHSNSSPRTADVSPRSSPLRDVSRFLLAKRPSVAMSEEKRLPFAAREDKGDREGIPHTHPTALKPYVFKL